ncbi:sigma-70 family RNA polymerase sigma factor [Pseudoflavitalea sp. G-6-1-2]|uniref:RNA polymerase sigma factor n=1 Tax=Pseudoflavitalea sp. G-6-1-2 TaxID=2728841 RepID=UPI00146F49F2|nr:sigma-70 family RNA polymerase sigma factor [Pseudoflavitalea sp. G-6-1-2]NML21394.1 sigma-70 family RNA polymerase sigma factor [Pseudoflavitalea sp. G-6-1-2]
MELWHGCQQDDVKAYNELVARYIPRLSRITHNIVKDPFVTTELVMDLLFSLWQKRHTLQIRENVSAYLFRAFKYMTIRHLRNALPQTIDIDALEEELPAGTSDYRLRYREAEKEFTHKLHQLSPQIRRTFELSRNENLSYKEIAERMSLSVKTVESYMVYALAHLRKHYSNAECLLLLTLGCLSI